MPFFQVYGLLVQHHCDDDLRETVNSVNSDDWRETVHAIVTEQCHVMIKKNKTIDNMMNVCNPEANLYFCGQSQIEKKSNDKTNVTLNGTETVTTSGSLDVDLLDKNNIYMICQDQINDYYYDSSDSDSPPKNRINRDTANSYQVNMQIKAMNVSKNLKKVFIRAFKALVSKKQKAHIGVFLVHWDKEVKFSFPVMSPAYVEKMLKTATPVGSVKP
jgi:hypothetical protein